MGTTLHSAIQFKQPGGDSWWTVVQVNHGKDYELQEWLSNCATSVNPAQRPNHRDDWPKDSVGAADHRVSYSAPLLLRATGDGLCGRARRALDTVWQSLDIHQKRIVWWCW